MSILRSQISGLEVQVVANGFLNGKVPLLRVTGAGIAINSEDPLPKTGIWIRWSHSNRGAAGKHERRIDIVLRLLPDCLHKRELRKCERCCDAGLFKPDHAIAGAD